MPLVVVVIVQFTADDSAHSSVNAHSNKAHVFVSLMNLVLQVPNNVHVFVALLSIVLLELVTAGVYVSARVS